MIKGILFIVAFTAVGILSITATMEITTNQALAQIREQQQCCLS